MIDVYWFSCWCKYWGHSNAGLYSKVFRRMVKIRWISLCIYRFFGAWWLHVIMVVVEGSSLVTSLTYWMASMVALWSGGCAYSDTHPFQEFCQSR